MSEFDLRALLSGGDRRSLAGAPEALILVREQPERTPELVRLCEDQDWLVAMRAFDLLEKIAQLQAERVQPYKHLFIGPMAEHESWEIRLQIVRALPLLRWTPAELTRVREILLRCVRDPQKFVRAWSLDSCARLAGQDELWKATVEALLKEFEQSPSAALKARARAIRRWWPAEPTS